MSKIVCIVCNSKSSDKLFDIPGLRFSFLEGAPFICEKCLYRILTNQARDWAENVKKMVNDEMEEV